MLETATSSAIFLVSCFGILLTWNTVLSFFVIGVPVLYCLDSCESVVCLAPYYCLLLSKLSVHRAIVIALSIVSSGSVCSLSDSFESRKSTIIRYRIVSMCTIYSCNVLLARVAVKLAML